MFLILVFVLLLVAFGVFLFVGTLFFQNLINTQPAEGLSWRAPAAAAALATFLTFWAFIVTRSDAKAGDIPYDAIHRFQTEVEMSPDPVSKFWSVRADGTKVLYLRRISDNLKTEYVDEKKKPYTAAGVVALEIENQGAVLKFEPVFVEDAPYRKFQSADGWAMQEYETGPTGLPSQARTGRLLMNILLNLLHLAVWFVCLWLLLQFRFGEAIFFALVLWLFMTFVFLPMLLDQAAEVAVAARQKAG